MRPCVGTNEKHGNFAAFPPFTLCPTLKMLLMFQVGWDRKLRNIEQDSQTMIAAIPLAHFLSLSFVPHPFHYYVSKYMQFAQGKTLPLVPSLLLLL